MGDFTVDEAWGVIETAGGCDHHVDVSFAKEDIESVFWYDYGCNCGSYSDKRKREAEEAAARRAAQIQIGEGLDDKDVFERDRGVMCNSYCDSWSEAFLRLKDGRYVAASESSDTTGHGCQCSGSIETWPTKADFLQLGLTEAKRVEIERYIE